MTVTKENLESIVNLLLAGNENVEIAKQLYLNFIEKDSILRTEFWDSFNDKNFFAESKRHSYYSTDEMVSSFIETIFSSFGRHGVPGLIDLGNHGETFEDLITTTEIFKKQLSEHGRHLTEGVNENTTWSIIGLNKWHRISGEIDYGFTNVTDYEFIIKGKNQRWIPLISVKFKEWHGSCGSGYCSASQGDCRIELYTGSENYHYIPTKYVPIELVQCDESFYLLDDSGCLIWSSGTGGDGYYPSGSIFPKDDMSDIFVPTAPERLLNLPNVYFFTGDSGLGKSYIGEILGRKELAVFETDAYEFAQQMWADEDKDYETRLYGMLAANVIVVGNREKDVTVDRAIEIYKKLAKLENINVNIVVCKFS